MMKKSLFSPPTPMRQDAPFTKRHSPPRMHPHLSQEATPAVFPPSAPSWTALPFERPWGIKSPTPHGVAYARSSYTPIVFAACERYWRYVVSPGTVENYGRRRGGWPVDLLFSRNARYRKTLVRHVQIRALSTACLPQREVRLEVLILNILTPSVVRSSLSLALEL